MESSKNWGKVRRVIDAAIAKYENDCANGYVSLSLTTTIYNTLKDHGWVPEDTEEIEDALETKWTGANTIVVDNGKVVAVDEHGRIK